MSFARIVARLRHQLLGVGQRHSAPLLQGQFGFRVVGFWCTAEVVSTDGTAVDEAGPDVVWLMAWFDHAEREKRWTALESSELWRDTVSKVVPYRRREGIVRFLEPILRSILQ